jgi:hypothetical protein
MHKAAFEIKRLVLAATGIGLISAMALPTNAAAMCAARTQLGGFWKSEDGATYDMRLTNGQVWWVGRSADGGTQWTHVFKGVLNGNTITGEWVDVSKQTWTPGAASRGTLTLELIGQRTALKGFRRVAETGGFGPRLWTAPCNDT